MSLVPLLGLLQAPLPDFDSPQKLVIRALLLVLLAGIGYYAFIKRRKFPLHVVLVFALLGLAGLAVVFSDATSRVANLVGVGRGADLITYLVTISLLFVVIHYYTKFVALESEVTSLVRELAILRAEIEQRDGSQGSR